MTSASVSADWFTRPQLLWIPVSLQLVLSWKHFLILFDGGGSAPWEVAPLSESYSKHTKTHYLLCWFLSTDHFRAERKISLSLSLSSVCRKVVEKSLNGSSVGVQLILLAPLETFNLTSGKLFLHKLKIIQSKLCKYIRWDKAGGGVAVYCEVKKIWASGWSWAERKFIWNRGLFFVSKSQRGSDELRLRLRWGKEEITNDRWSYPQFTRGKNSQFIYLVTFTSRCSRKRVGGLTW